MIRPRSTYNDSALVEVEVRVVAVYLHSAVWSMSVFLLPVMLPSPLTSVIIVLFFILKLALYVFIFTVFVYPQKAHIPHVSVCLTSRHPQLIAGHFWALSVEQLNVFLFDEDLHIATMQKRCRCDVIPVLNCGMDQFNFWKQLCLCGVFM